MGKNNKNYSVEKRFWNWFSTNLIYCEDTHSFVHRLYDKIKSGKTKTGKKIEGYRDVQHLAFGIVAEMKNDFVEKCCETEKKIKLK